MASLELQDSPVEVAAPSYWILPGRDSVDAVLAVSLRPTNGQVYAVLREVARLGWELAPDRLSRLAGDLHHIGLMRVTHPAAA